MAFGQEKQEKPKRGTESYKPGQWLEVHILAVMKKSAEKTRKEG